MQTVKLPFFIDARSAKSLGPGAKFVLSAITLPEAVAGSEVVALAESESRKPPPLCLNVNLKAVGVTPGIAAQVRLSCTETVLLETRSKASAEAFKVATFNLLSI